MQFAQAKASSLTTNYDTNKQVLEYSSSQVQNNKKPTEFRSYLVPTAVSHKAAPTTKCTSTSMSNMRQKKNTDHPLLKTQT